jgi:hypothetical protein
MAVDRRIPIGGSIRSLSPTEGKFRVKGTAWGWFTLGVISGPERAANQSRWSFSAAKRCSNQIAAFFAWQNHPDYRQCVLINTRFSGRK